MRGIDPLLLPAGVLFLAAAGAVLADRRVRVRADGDRGDFWASVVQRVCLLLGLPIALSGATAVVDSYWQTGRHLHFDLTGVFGWQQQVAYRIALLLPFAVWALILIVGLLERPDRPGAGRWLAGSIGFKSSRTWVLVWTLPLAVTMVMTLGDLGGGADAYPGAAWGTLAVLLLSLVGVALSAGSPGTARETKVTPPELEAKPSLRPWPEALVARGVQLQTLAVWPATTQARSVRDQAAGDLHERLRQRKALAVAPELIEAVDGLLGAVDDKAGCNRLILAPDDCGQVEVVALAAELLDQRFHAATLVVTAGNAEALAAELGRWLPQNSVKVAEMAGGIPHDALIIVCDAQILSDRVLPQLKNPAQLRRFGLIVWWHLEAYTGVLAANLWAISRRLHRLLEAMGRHDLRTLVFVRSSPHGSAQLGAFVRRLLPHPMPAASEVSVEARLPRTIELHLLESAERYFANGDGRSVPEKQRHLPLVAAKVSVEENWRTRLEVPADISANEAQAFLRLTVGNAVLRDRLETDTATSDARVRELQAGEVLSLAEIIGHGGRSAADGLPHHVGITAPSNPYAAYLLSTLTGSGGSARFSTSRRLISAAAQPSVVRRHLLLALDEMPDTRSGLLKNFLWNEKVIRLTLEEIAGKGQLERSEVRFLDERGELRREHEYKSTWVPTDERRPLDTVGDRLIEVRDTAAGYEAAEGVRMLVDPERLTIEAYPYRVFLHGGQRYQVKEWDSIEMVERLGRLECVRQDIHSQTWRMRHVSVFGIELKDAPVGIGGKGRLVTRLTASLQYQEDVVGVYRVTPILGTSEVKVDTPRLAKPIERTFVTRGLILRFPEEQPSIALASLAQALRHLLPVHLGVEEDALEVVPLTGELVQGRPSFGLAIVDLYPGGIGLVDAIGDDNAFLLQLLEWARDWLVNCPCRSDQGCSRCLRSPAALAANSDQPPMRSAAIDLLRLVV